MASARHQEPPRRHIHQRGRTARQSHGNGRRLCEGTDGTIMSLLRQELAYLLAMSAIRAASPPSPSKTFSVPVQPKSAR